VSRFDRFGAKLGVVVALAGFVLIFLGWNGAASVDRLTAQFPYLISGGMAGLGLVIFGAILIAVDARRDDEKRLETMLIACRICEPDRTSAATPSRPARKGRRPGAKRGRVGPR
jgi:hypothetical protein